MDLCVQFIIFAFYDELISNKTLLQLRYNTYTTFSKTILHKTLQHYSCIARVTY